MPPIPVTILVVVLLAGCAAAPTRGGPTVDVAQRTVAPVLGELHRVVTPEGIELQEKVMLGGIPQWIQIRGRDRKNPVLLFLHGGPGYPVMPASHLHQTQWEEYFTVVHWDQRGAGKTYGETDPERVRPTMTIARFVQDAEELVSHLRDRFGHPRIVLVGRSWGTILAVELIRRHPDWFHAYVAAGQFVDFRESERRGFEGTLAKARAAKDAMAIAELEAIAPFPPPGVMPLEKLGVQRRWLVHYGGYRYRRTGDRYHDVVMLSPAYSDADIEAFDAGSAFSVEALWPELGDLDLRAVTELRCPVILFNGRDDLNVNAALSAEWFDRLEAPAKKLVWFEHSAHMLFEDEPGKVLVHLVNDVLPLTR